MRNVLDFSRKYGIVVITIALFITLAVTTDGFATDRNFRNLLDQQSTILIAASFMTIRRAPKCSLVRTAMIGNGPRAKL